MNKIKIYVNGKPLVIPVNEGPDGEGADIKVELNNCEDGGEGIKVTVNGEDTDDFFEIETGADTGSQMDERTKKLSVMLPLMDDEDVHEFMETALKENDIELIKLMLPYLSEEDCDSLFYKSLVEKSIDIPPSTIAPLVSDEMLSDVVDKYVSGEIADMDLESIYVFLSSKDIKKLFEYLLKNK